MKQRWPQGPLAHEVALRIIETLLRAGDQQEAGQAAREFLAQFPNSPRAGEIRAMVQKK
jgi:outer membrane protein assembly factor BamD (BamD/ComL family)